ncbi:protein lifeguard 1-like [Nilaparvata lugens]|uniref:protein lifeguard 1-like n=1 Tax=Nilaparvata lugens TaxID=108931 RepID=UPI00193D23D5|nr:protein lifeguard 1-like [Nilaparvata lugens]
MAEEDIHKEEAIPGGGYGQGYPQGGYGPYPQGGYPQQGYQPNQNIGPYRMARQDGFYDEETYEAFSDEDVRRDFVRNVYSVLSLQLLFTTAMIALFTFSDEVQEWALDNLWVMWVGMGVFLFSYLALVCYESVRRSFPMNFIFLVLLTVGMSFIASYATLQYGTRIILITAGLTCAVCITVTIIACVCPIYSQLQYGTTGKEQLVRRQ